MPVLWHLSPVSGSIQVGSRLVYAYRQPCRAMQRLNCGEVGTPFRLRPTCSSQASEAATMSASPPLRACLPTGVQPSTSAWGSERAGEHQRYGKNNAFHRDFSIERSRSPALVAGDAGAVQSV
jgi:hypothetical protein